ncbi:MAG: HTH-like domain-containing protein [Gammaproteobacteria bacterium]
MPCFIFQVLKNAQALSNDDPVEFCRRVNVPESYATEFRKMLALARMARRQGMALRVNAPVNSRRDR